MRGVKLRARCFTRCQDDRDSSSHGNFVARANTDICQNAGTRRFDLDRRLVGFDFHERLAFGNRLAFGFEPLEQSAGLLRHAERGHDYVGGQRDLSSIVQVFQFNGFIPYSLQRARIVEIGLRLVCRRKLAEGCEICLTATNSFSAGKRVITSQPSLVTTTSSSKGARLIAAHSSSRFANLKRMRGAGNAIESWLEFVLVHDRRSFNRQLIE